MDPLQDNGLATSISAFSFEGTIDRIEQAILSAGMTIFSRVDHVEAARSVGLAMAAATVLTYGIQGVERPS